MGRVSQHPPIQLAAACFVTDTSGCSGNEFGGNNADDNDGGVPPGGDDYDLDNAERCRQEGYTQTSCPEGQEPVNFCPYDSSYFEKCVSSCPSNYVTCEVPYYGVGEDCDGKYASCEKDTERACKEENPNYTNSCDYGQQLSDDRCSYDSSYGTCCNTCAGYPYTKDNIPEGYVQDGQSCTGCDGQEHYKIKPNPCDGFMDCGSMGPEIGAKSCQSGNQIKYDNCKACPNLGSLTYCPAPFTCSYEDCSCLYYKTGCQPGYDWNESTKTCTKQCAYECTLTSCPSPFTCRYEECSGKYCKTGCQSGYEWNSGSQTCRQCTSNYKYRCQWTGEKVPQDEESCDGNYTHCLCEDYFEENPTVTDYGPAYCQERTVPCDIGTYYRMDGTCVPTYYYSEILGIVIDVEGNGGTIATSNALGLYFASSDLRFLISAPVSKEDAEKVGLTINTLETIDEDNSDSCQNTEAFLRLSQMEAYKEFDLSSDFKALTQWYPEYSFGYEYVRKGSFEETKGKWCLPSGNMVKKAMETDFFSPEHNSDLSTYYHTSSIVENNGKLYIGYYAPKRNEWDYGFLSGQSAYYNMLVMQVKFK